MAVYTGSHKFDQLLFNNTYTVATLPAVINGQVIYVSDGAALLYVGRGGEWVPVLNSSLDGYITVNNINSIGDGYIAFFTGTDTNIAGDNDLYWNRETNSLQLGGSIVPFADNTIDLGANLTGRIGNIYVGTSIISGTNTFTKTITAGDIIMDNGTADSPGIKFYSANNVNQGIDGSTSGLRLITNLDESGGAVRLLIGTGGAGLRGDNQLYWVSGILSPGVADTGFSRHTVGTIKVTDGSTGYGNLTVGRIIFQGDIDLGQTLDGYAGGGGVSETTFQENKNYWDESIYQLRTASDGYVKAQDIGATGDGYIAFFTGTETNIAGDNDLYWNRETNNLHLGGNILSGSGSLSSPTYSFTGNSNSGIYSAGTNLLGVSLGGVSWGVLDTTGGGAYSNIRVGTTTGLHISNSSGTPWARVEAGRLLFFGTGGASRSIISGFSTDGSLLLTDSAGTSFSNLYFGDTATGIATSTVSLGFVLSSNARFQITNTGGAFYWDTGTGHTTFGSSVAVRDSGFVRQEAGLIRVSNGSTGYGNLNVGRIIFQDGVDLGQTLDGYAGGSGTLISRMLLGDQWLFVDGYWSVTSPAEIGYINGVPIRAFDQTTAEGAGDVWHIDAGATTIDFAISGAASSSGFTSNNGVQLEIHFRTALTSGGWTTFALTPLTLTDDANIQEFTQSHSLATIGMTAGQTYQVELCRAPSDGDDTLTRDFYLVSLTIKQES